jgi:ribonuclease Z
MKMLKLILLGTGTPIPRPNRCGSSCIVLVNDEPLMFDCGPGATLRLVATSVPLTAVNHLFFTHHHYDHNTDYGHFVLARWDRGLGKIRALQVYGPIGTERATTLLFGEDGVFAPDIEARINYPVAMKAWVDRGGSLPRTRPDLGAKDVHPGVVCTGRDWQITAAPVIHAKPYLDSLAYRLDCDHGSIVLSGDTAPCRSIVDLARGADLLLHMCGNFDDPIEFNGQSYPVSTPKGAAMVAREAGVKTLVLTHLGPAFDEPEKLQKALEEARSIFAGTVIFGEDLMEIAVS